MKPFLFSFFLFAFTVTLNGQNLVPNPSFEDTITCYPRIDSVKHWHNPTDYTPDYFNVNMRFINNKVPLNLFGYQEARTGNAYAGIITLSGDAREYIQARLLDSLRAGKKYRVIFYVCIPDSSPYASNDIGAYFSKNAISSSDIYYLPYIPQINNDPTLNPLNRLNMWIPIIDSFIADGGEKYITIGNFKNEVNTDTTDFNYHSYGQPFGYDFIDDVSVTLIDLETGIAEIDNNSIKITYDFTIGVISVTSSVPIRELQLYNIKGELISDKKINSEMTKISFNYLPTNLYLLKIKTDQNVLVKKLF